MRVLMLSDVYFPRVNGVSTSMETFRRALHSEGIEVRLLVPRYADEASTPEITRVSGYRVLGDPEDRLVGWRSMHREAQLAAADCQLVHIQTPFVAHYAGIKSARRLGLPVLATYHTLFEEYLQHYAPFLPAGWLRRQARRLSKSQCNALDAVVVPSTAMQSRLSDYGVNKPMHVLPTGIPVNQFAGGNGRAFRHRHGILSTRPLAVFVGRVAHEKNIEFLLDALLHTRQYCPDILLAIVGEGPAMESLKLHVKALRLQENVQFIGYLERQSALPDCYAAADVFVFASRTETQGLVLLEAMAAGTPVVALAAMGTVDILAPQRGAVSPPDQPRAFGHAIARVINQRSLRERLKQEAVKYAQEWSDQSMAKRLATLYRTLANRGQPSLASETNS
jgi:1,2-diacylglycerol 3-alpha-glucosyltransferase